MIIERAQSWYCNICKYKIHKGRWSHLNLTEAIVAT